MNLLLGRVATAWMNRPKIDHLIHHVDDGARLNTPVLGPTTRQRIGAPWIQKHPVGDIKRRLGQSVGLELELVIPLASPAPVPWPSVSMALCDGFFDEVGCVL